MVLTSSKFKKRNKVYLSRQADPWDLSSVDQGLTKVVVHHILICCSRKGQSNSAPQCGFDRIAGCHSGHLE